MADLPVPQDRSSAGAPRTEKIPTLPPLEKKKQAAPKDTGLVSWWPVAVGLALGVLSPQLRLMLGPYEPWGMRVVFPSVLLSGMRETGFSDELTRAIPQLMLFLQFPLEGLLTRFNLNRGVTLAGALGQLVSLHGVCALVIWLVSLA